MSARRRSGLFYTVSGIFSSLSLTLSSPLTSAFSRSRFSIRAWSSASSDSVTALGSILTTKWPPAASMLDLMLEMASSNRAMPAFLSKHVLVRLSHRQLRDRKLEKRHHGGTDT